MNNKAFFIAAACIFTFFILAAILVQNALGLNLAIVIGGNTLLLLLTVASYLLLMRTQNTNPRKFVNSMLMSSMLKIFTTIAAVGIIGYKSKPNIPKTSIMFIMLAYIVYSVVEHRFVIRANKKMTNTK